MNRKSLEPTATSPSPLGSLPFGILGDGQLGLFLTQAAQHFGHKVYLWPPESQGPAAAFADKPDQIAASFDRFADGCEYLAIENELQALGLSQQLSAVNQAKLRPSLDVLKVLADKGRQKELLVDLKIPTARFERYEGTAEDCEAWLLRQSQNFPRGFVLKWTRGGYDGRGVRICRQLKPALQSELKHFVEAALSQDSGVYAEELIPYQSEMALVATRSLAGEFCLYPTVVTEQQQGVCHLVRGPASAWGLTAACEREAARIGTTLALAVDLVGTFAVEFFVTREGELLVNEIAPRVHNSGHFSLDVSVCSQFDNHWRALAGIKLGSSASSPFFAMINILGPEDFVGAVKAFTFASPLARVYWYGKKEMRPGRKMGHINLWGERREDVEALLTQIQAQLNRWSDAYTAQGRI